MKKILLQLSVLLFTFFGLFFLFQQINWMKLFKVNETKLTLEQKLGDQLWKFYSEGQREITEKEIVGAINKIFEKICEENNIEKEKIKLKIIDNEEINAFAFPNNYLVVHTALLLEAKNEAELAGVLAHEIAHIVIKHVMKKLINDIQACSLAEQHKKVASFFEEWQGEHEQVDDILIIGLRLEA